MLVTVTCDNPHCRHEIGRSDVPPGNVPNYVLEVSRQKVHCPKCARIGAAKVETHEPEPEPEPEVAPTPEAPVSVVPDTLPADIGADADADDDNDKEDGDINTTDS